MNNTKQGLPKVLVGITIVSVAVATYLGLKTNELKIQLTKDNIEASNEEESPREEALTKIDSLLALEEYEEAITRSKALQESNEFKNMRPLDLRAKMASTILQLQRQSKSLKENRVNENDSANFEAENILDLETLQSELASAKNEISNLKGRLSTNASNDYLEFKTSKGTQLHYVGSVKQNKANGYGIALLDTGSRYEGQWLNNARHGSGKFFWDDGEIYEGEYSNDMRHGTGTYTWSNGEKYVGEWKNDMRNGHGIFYNKRGKIKTEGTWEDDKLIEEE